MKITNLFFALSMLIATVSFSQTVIEKTHELSKDAAKGYFFDAIQNPENGNIEVTYKFKKGSKDADVTYETYYFDKNLTFIKNEEIKWTAKDQSPYTKTYVYATVGGCSSFSILSMNLNLAKQTWNYTWNGDKKRFVAKRTENVAIKLENAEKHAYSGYAAYRENATGKMMVLASTETKGSDGKIKKDFILLEMKTDLTIKEIDLPLEASQLVYCDIVRNDNAIPNEDDNDAITLDEGDMVYVFAPTFNKSATVDYKKHTYLRVDKNGVIKENFKIDAPSANLIITGFGQAKDGSVYICGSYSKEKETFDQLFKEYSPLINPCYTGGINYRMDTYEAKTEKVPMNYFTLLKVKDGKVDWIKSTSIEDLTKVIKTPEKQKAAPAYSGKRFRIEYFNVSITEIFLFQDNYLAV